MTFIYINIYIYTHTHSYNTRVLLRQKPEPQTDSKSPTKACFVLYRVSCRPTPKCYMHCFTGTFKDSTKALTWIELTSTLVLLLGEGFDAWNCHECWLLLRPRIYQPSENGRRQKHIKQRNTTVFTNTIPTHKHTQNVVFWGPLSDFHVSRHLETWVNFAKEHRLQDLQSQVW